MGPPQSSLLGFSYEGHPAGNGSCADIKLSMLLCRVISQMCTAVSTARCAIPLWSTESCIIDDV